MNRNILALGGGLAAFMVGHSWAQQYAAAAPTPTAVGTDTSVVASTPLDTPPAAEPATQDLAVNDNPQTAAATASQPATPAPAPSAADISAQSAAPSATTPSTADVSATTASSNMAYAKDIANAPHGAFKADVGEYPMRAYAMPPRPLPYDQLDAYLKATPQQQASNDWWQGSSQLAEATTSPSGNVSAPTAPSSDVSAAVPAPAPSNSQAGIPGDTPTNLNRDTPAPDTSVNPATPAAPTPPDQTIDNTPI